MWFDSHCHLQAESDPAGAVTRARAAGVGWMVCVGTDADESARAVELAVELGAAAGGAAAEAFGLAPADRL